MLVLVSYDLKQPGRDYSAVYDLLKTVPAIRILESLWVLRTSQSVQTWSDRIKSVVDDNDRFFVVDITNDTTAGWLAQSSWDWISQNQAALR